MSLVLLVAIAVGDLPASATGRAPDAAANTAHPPKKPLAVFGTQTSGATQPDSRGYFNYGATPGGEVRDHIAILNYSVVPLQLLVKGEDAVNTPDGGFALLPPNERSTQVGVWIVLPVSGAPITIPARSRVILPFVVSVPQNATPGDHVGGITATLVGVVRSKSGQVLKLLQSLGTRIFIRVSGPLRPLLAVHNLRVRYDDPISPLRTGTAVLTYTVSNVGNVALGGRPSAWVAGLFGSKEKATKLPDVQVLLPGFSVTESAKVKGVYPELIESAHVSVNRLIVPGSVQPPSGPLSASASFWAVPWVLIGIIVLALAAAEWWWRRRRKSRSRLKGVIPVSQRDPTPELILAPNSADSSDRGSETTK